MPPSTDVLVPLAGGYVAPARVVCWLIEASFRLRFRVSPDGRLLVEPRSAISPADDRFIRVHRDDLVRAVAYVEAQAERPL